jgi:polyisoprenoid-binding protein YceI
MMFTTVRGRFNALRGTIVEVADDPSRSSVEVAIEAATVATGDERRDAHLRSPDFLDVEKHPTITFRSTRVEGGEERFRVVGDLTVRGTTREVVLNATLNGRGTNPNGKQVVGLTAETSINRSDFGLTWNVALEAGGVLVGDVVRILLEVQAIRQA